MTKCCGCGTYHNAAERAAQLMKKMAEDDECVIFTLAVGVALLQICVNVANKAMENEGLEAVRISEVLKDTIHGSSDAVSSGDFADIVKVAFEEAAKRYDAERKMN